MVTVMREEVKSKIAPLIKEVSGAVEDLSDWHFVYGPIDAIEEVYSSLRVPYPLYDDWYSEYVFIVDKDLKLRGRDDDEDEGIRSEERRVGKECRCRRVTGTCGRRK